MKYTRRIILASLYVAAVILCVMTVWSIWQDKDEISAYKEARAASSETSAMPFEEYFDGSGTERNPYLISSVADLDMLRQLIAEGNSTSGLYFRQTQDIDLEGIDWLPLASTENPFSATYDGAGHQIVNLTLSNANSSFIGALSGMIENTVFTNAYISAMNCAVITNTTPSTLSTMGTMLNCIVSNVNTSTININAHIPTVAVMANDIGGGQVLACYAAGNPQNIPFVNNASAKAFVRYSGFTVLASGASESIQTTSNFHVTEDNVQACVDYANSILPELGSLGIRDTLNYLTAASDGGISLSDETVSIYSQSRLDNTKEFVKHASGYILALAVMLLTSILLSRFAKLNLAKCIVYSMLGACAVILLVAGFETRGEWISTMLYDVTKDGQTKHFTDFTDCILPGINPYANEFVSSTIYPPLISLVFTVFHHFMPFEILTDTITVRNSQLGSLIFLFWTMACIVMMYEVIMSYKKGRKVEKVAFFVLLCSTYPFIHCMERGNVVFLAALLIAVFLFNYRSESFWKRQLAFFALSAAAGIKIYPAFLGILLLKEKRFKDTLNCLAIGIVVNLAPCMFFDTGFSSMAYMLINATAYVGGNDFIGGKIDLSHYLKLPGELLNLPSGADPMEYLNIILLGLFALTVIIVLFSKMADWKIYMLCIMGLILLPTFSPYYYILYAIAPLMMFLDSTSYKKKLSFQTILYSVLFVGIFMAFATDIKYPLQAFIPSQSVWHSTIITGTFLVLFEAVLLIDGTFHCFARLWKAIRK